MYLLPIRNLKKIEILNYNCNWGQKLNTQNLQITKLKIVNDITYSINIDIQFDYNLYY